MSKCKHCEAKVNAILGRGDGLCKECGVIADEQAKVEAAQKELMRRQQVLEEAKANLDLIVKSLSTEEPLCFTFINWGIEEKKKDGVGFWVGGALGGVMGAVIGSVVSPGSCKYSGELGLLIVKENKLLLSHLKVPFQSAAASINHEHLKIFLSKLGTQDVTSKYYNICQLQYIPQLEASSTASIVYATETISFRKSDLIINDSLQEMSDLTQIQDVLSTQGSLITPHNFIALLDKGECAISEDRYLKIKHDKKYLNDIFELIITHPNRDNLVQQLKCLPPSFSGLMSGRLKELAASSRGARLGVIVWIFILICGLWGIFHPYLVNLYLCIAVTVIGFIFLLVSNSKLKRAKWCKKVIGE